MKKRLILSMLLMAATATGIKAGESRQDSLYLFSYATEKNNNTDGLHFAWSADGKRWNRIGSGYAFVKSDYGPWGSGKKMFDPVLERQRGGMWTCSWTVKPDGQVIALTESHDLLLWKPQDYMPAKVKMGPDRNVPRKTITLPDGEKVSGTMHRVEQEVVNRLVAEYERRQYRQQLHGERMADDGRRFAGLKDVSMTVTAMPEGEKAISPELFGVFFEDINYAADGGLYGEMLQNRDFEYSEADRARQKGWGHTFAWETAGGAKVEIKTDSPIHKNNPHYAVLTAGGNGASMANKGYDGITVKKGLKYNMAMHVKAIGRKGGKIRVAIVDAKGKEIAAGSVNAANGGWKKRKVQLTATADASGAQLVLTPQQAGQYAFDMVSMFPKNTFKNRENGMRPDLAQAIADLKPRFVRFPGGCVAHGNGLHNIYRWKNTIGPLEERIGMRNIWAYRQSMGLGYYEYFQFCEDLGAEPLPVLAAGVPCQNSSDGGDGQQGGIPLGKEMDQYIQDVLDLIEWANGDKNTTWGRKRAEAGHPKPFNLKYVGIGNEDLISEVFKERFTLIYNAVKEKHPEIEVIGTVGPFCEGSDYEYGWQLAGELDIPIVDEHYYCPPGWFIHNRDFYDAYDRTKSKVYLGEYASHIPGRGNTIETALSIALYLTDVERNADVVKLSSYAPLMARHGHTQWRPDMMYFDNDRVNLTTDYHVQRMFGQNAGSRYVPATTAVSDSRYDVGVRLGQSIVRDEATGDIVVKLANLLPVSVSTTVDLGKLVDGPRTAIMEQLQGQPDDSKAKPTTSTISAGSKTSISLPAYSLSVIRIKAQ